MLKKIVSAVMTFAVTFGFLLNVEAANSKDDNWLIYWYVCGTDIETTRIDFKNGSTDLMSGKIGLAEPDRNPGDASRCIREVEKAELSPNVKIFMQAGGAYVWGHEKFRDNNAKLQTDVVGYYKNPDGTFSPVQAGGRAIVVPQWRLKKNLTPVENGKLSRYVYDKDHRNWFPREQFQISGERDSETDMGSPAGLISFLQAGQKLERELYPDGNVRRVLIFVDHGGGSLQGVCLDEYTQNILSLKEIRDSFAAVKNGWTNTDEKPFEVVAFDACIMSTYETAVALEDVAKYMVASQESMYGKVMFGYTDLLNKLSKNPAMSGKAFGKAICDAYWEDSKNVDKEFRGLNSNSVLTMSVIDLSETKMDALKTAYNNFSKESLDVARQNPEEFLQTFTKFKNAANVSENFSIFGSKKAVDLKNFAENVSDNFEELKDSGKTLANSIKKAVVYQKRGDVFKRGGGLSTYYPFSLFTDYDGLCIQAYGQLGKDNLAPTTQAQLYDYLRTNAISKISSVNLNELSNEMIFVDEEKKTAQIELDEDALKKIGVGGVHCQLAWVSSDTRLGAEKVQMLALGGDSGMIEDRESGKFESAFNGKWITVNGVPVFNQIVSDGTVKNKHGKKVGGVEIRLVPIRLNGEPQFMYISCEYPKEKFTIIGIAGGADEQSSLPSGNVKSLQKGDVIDFGYLYVNDDVNNLEDFENVNEMTDEQKIQFAKKYLRYANTMTVGDKIPKVEISTLPDGKYFYTFTVANPITDEPVIVGATSGEGVVFTVKGGKVTEVKHANDITEISYLEN